MAEEETIIVNPKVESEETIFPSLGLSNFEKQMKAFNSYSALNKFRDERGISPAFNYDTLGAYTAGNLLDLKNYGTSKFSVDSAGKITCVGLAAGSQKITGVLDPTANQDAATKKYVDDNENTGLWEIDGTETQLKTADEIDMRSKKIINLTDPATNQDGATKKYVDDNITSPYVSFNVNGSQAFADDGSPHSVSLTTFACGFDPSLIIIRGQLKDSYPLTQPPYWIGQYYTYLEGIWDGTNYSGTTCYEYNADLRKTTEGFLTYEGQGNSHRYKLEVESSNSDGFTLRVKIEHFGSIAKTIYWRFDIIAYK